MMKLFKEAKNRGRVVSAIMKRRAKMMAARGQAVKTMLKRRMQAIRKGMIRNMQRLRGGHGPRWMPRAFFMKMWLRKTLSQQCPEAAKMCPVSGCPKRTIRCIRQHNEQVSEQWSGFLSKWKTFKANKKAAKRVFREARRECREGDEEEEDIVRDCIWKARKRLFATMKEHRQAFKTELEAQSPVAVHTADDKARLFGKAEHMFEDKMKGLVQIMSVLGGGKAATGCKSDDDCQAGGDMGGYCKANKDCHCSAPFFGSDGKGGCELTCTPTSKPTACCRDNSDCTAGGDANAYCKSPKSNHHTTPGNGMCRCGTGFTGTTSCHKAAPKTEAKTEAKDEDLDEGTPDFLTGDAEAPEGEEDMGGWTMRVYTKEQQARLHIDKTGKAVKAAPEKNEEELPAAEQSTELVEANEATEQAEEKREEEAGAAFHGQAWATLGLVGLMLLMLGFAFVIKNQRERRQSMELRAVYGQAMSGTQTSCDQI